MHTTFEEEDIDERKSLKNFEKEKHKFEEEFTFQTKNELLFLVGSFTPLCASS
jgi:hypothetical protein